MLSKSCAISVKTKLLLYKMLHGVNDVHLAGECVLSYIKKLILFSKRLLLVLVNTAVINSRLNKLVNDYFGVPSVSNTDTFFYWHF